ncbi:efflux RND transporter periplasmic adaptor subunit [Marinobacter zhejiangensis]|uniref:Membrane fusion protein, multidrug efflux system n=1 Tax=Marinobacter zhejiangensis TaxID=488535 RepID=A0A1I4LRB5_9GAMM|nr:efflux RND transporter periplasmic adaptor subunit [Marinobacter zhejiangensis]SFL93353.1 membrane fusion protein, multidrug efflux system [Marinobacter zhejiangensis]
MKQGLIALAILMVAVITAMGYQWLAPTEEAGTGRSRPPSLVNITTPLVEVVADALTAVGTLKSRQAVAVTAEVSGRVVELNVQPGEVVAKGQLLVRLDDRQAQADLQVADAQFADAQRQYDRASRLVANNSIAQSRLDELRTALDVARAQRVAARIRLENHRIEAPFAGIVGLTDISLGSYLSEGETITTLDDTREMELEFSVPERYLGQLAQGQQVAGETPAYPGQVFHGTLVELGARVSELSRTLPVRALVDNSEGRLRPGQFMSVSLTLGQREALVIPEQAILMRGADSFVFVVEDGVAKRTRVTLGSREPGLVEIQSGLSADDAVVVTGQDRLSNGESVQVSTDDEAMLDHHLADRTWASSGANPAP